MRWWKTTPFAHPDELLADSAGDARNRHLGTVGGLARADGDGTGGSLSRAHGHLAAKGRPGGLGSGVRAASARELGVGSHGVSSHRGGDRYRRENCVAATEEGGAETNLSTGFFCGFCTVCVVRVVVCGSGRRGGGGGEERMIGCIARERRR